MKGKEREENRKRRRRGGFTLVELLVVITILGILAAVGVVNVMKNIEDSRIVAARTGIAEWEKAIQIFSMGHAGKLPDSLSEMTVGTDDDPPLMKEGAMNDPWGNEYGYTKKGKTFKITSAGPDGEMGTADDITN